LNFAGASASSLSPVAALPQNGDVWVHSDKAFGAGGEASDAENTGGTSKATEEFEAFHSSAMGSGALNAKELGLNAGSSATNFAYLKEGATSQQTSDYFAVGSTIEVLGTGKLGATAVNNQYRKFKVTGHFTNSFNKEFAKLDSFPADDGTTSTFLDKDYLLKITSNNGTVHNYDDTFVRVNVNEVQVIVIDSDGASDNNDEVFTLSYKGEESQDITEASTVQQVAEEINGFSALSGPVTVTKSGSVWTVTFHERDGDVALLSASKSSGTAAVTTFTKHHGWSIEAPIEFGLDTMQAGGLVNITALEVCAFESTTALPDDAYFCYDGVCGGDSVDATAANLQSALLTIKDDNGVSVLTGIAEPDVSGTTLTITLPTTSHSCDKLEMRSTTLGSAAAFTKTVNKHNNGKQFRIARSFLHKHVAGAAASTIAAGAVTFTQEAALFSAVAGLDSVMISDVSTCGAKNTLNGDIDYPIVRRVMNISGAVFGSSATGVGISSVSTAGVMVGSAQTADLPQVWVSCDPAVSSNPIRGNGRYQTSSDGNSLLEFHTGAAITLSGTLSVVCTPTPGLGLTAEATPANCGVAFGRHVITLDSMPTVSARTVKKSLRYTSPVGGCSVEETTKGTYESYECSNRGACDGKSGLCQCYEGYSGQSCQTQTVLV